MIIAILLLLIILILIGKQREWQQLPENWMLWFVPLMAVILFLPTLLP